jgi:4-aminobutyrate--pyruvate transaminase
MNIGAHVGRSAPICKRTAPALRRHPLVGEVRGVGLIAAMELVADKASTRTSIRARRSGIRLMKLMEENGVIGRSVANDSLCFSPPLIISKARSTRCWIAPARRWMS